MSDTISFDEAVQMLPEGEQIHTFRNGSGMMIGADWDRADLLDMMKECEIFLTGEVAQSLNHGLAIKDRGSFLFIETKLAAWSTDQ